jgi:ketosteroid isomerase-like protein
MEAPVTSADDEQALRDLVYTYADAVNRRDVETWRALWAEDGVWEAFGQAFEGRDKVVATWQGAMQGFALVFHVSHHGVLTVDGDEAHGRWTISEQLKGADGTPGILLALYHDDYRRESGRWRFVRRRLEVRYQGPPDLSGSPA